MHAPSIPVRRFSPTRPVRSVPRQQEKKEDGSKQPAPLQPTLPYPTLPYATQPNPPQPPEPSITPGPTPSLAGSRHLIPNPVHPHNNNNNRVSPASSVPRKNKP